MAVTLEITFTGLFTFVPSNDGKELVVLLPRTGVLSRENRVHQHHAHLIVERGCLLYTPLHPEPDDDCMRGSAQDGDQPSDSEDHSHPGHMTDADAQRLASQILKDFECIPFGRYRLEFTGLAAGTHVTPPDAAVDLTPYAGTLKPTQLTPAPDDNVWAQVVLPAAREVLRVPGVAKWKMGGVMKNMSHQVVWRSEVGEGGASITFRHMGGGEAGKIALKPRDGETTIYVGIEHLPHKRDRHVGKKCDNAPHFLAYYDLFGNSTTGPLPVLQDKPPLKVDDKFTCMTSQAKSGT